MSDFYNRHIQTPFDELGIDNTHDSGFTCTTGGECRVINGKWTRAGVVVRDKELIAKLDEKCPNGRKWPGNGVVRKL